MKKYLILIFLVFSSAYAFCQFPSEVWHEGKIVLLQGDTLQGWVKYDLETDIIQFTVDERTIQTYTARKLLHFEIFDKLSGRYRQFYVLPYAIQNDFEAPIFFELIYEGRHLTLLSREAIEYQVTNYPYSIAGSYTRLVLVYTHFFLTDEGKIVKYSGKKKDLYNGVMNKRGQEIKKYIKKNKFKTDKQADLLKITVYYNSLFEDK